MAVGLPDVAGRAAGRDQGGATRGPGRPRDPRLEARAHAAALQVFGEKGWVGLTMDEVAARARVGKSSLYLRWPDRESLLASALRTIQASTPTPTAVAGPGAGEPGAAAPATADETDQSHRTGDAAQDEQELSLRDYLVAHAMDRAELYLGENGLAMLRLYTEARAHPEVLADVREEAIGRFVREERHRVERAVRDGSLPPTASPMRILDAVEGAIFMHILVTPPELVARVRQGLAAYVEAMVDDQLRAAGFTPRES